jgi:farnesol dehydrogenase
MKVLVTGGTGYLGSAIVRALAAHGHQPFVFARHAGAAALPGVAVKGDIRDRRAVEEAVRRVDAVCHTAALVSLWRPQASDFDDVNVGGLRTVFEACAGCGTQRIVYTSSFLALPPAGRPAAIEANDYQRTKVRGRELARAAISGGLPIVTLYPGVIYGAGAYTEGNLVGRLVRDHLAGRLPGVIGASRIWSCAPVTDVAEAHVRALEVGRPGEEFMLGGENVPQMRVFEVVRELTGRRLPLRIPAIAAFAVGALAETQARLTGRPPLVTRGAVQIFQHDWPLDSASSAARLNYRPLELRAGLESLLRNLP